MPERKFKRDAGRKQNTLHVANAVLCSLEFNSLLTRKNKKCVKMCFFISEEFQESMS